MHGPWYDRKIMDTLWAPWRIGYVTAEKQKDCIFCTKLNEGRDRDNFILFRGDYCFVVLNIYPYNNGHLMIVPYEHLASLEDLPLPTATEVMTVTQKALGALRESLQPSGFNIGVNEGASAGAGIADHVHIHVVPRWVGD